MLPLISYFRILFYIIYLFSIAQYELWLELCKACCSIKGVTYYVNALAYYVTLLIRKELRPGPNIIKLFTAVSYDFS